MVLFWNMILKFVLNVQPPPPKKKLSFDLYIYSSFAVYYFFYKNFELFFFVIDG